MITSGINEEIRRASGGHAPTPSCLTEYRRVSLPNCRWMADVRFLYRGWSHRETGPPQTRIAKNEAQLTMPICGGKINLPGAIRCVPAAIYGRSTSGTVIEPSACW